jgi:hypothetical protein
MPPHGIRSGRRIGPFLWAAGGFVVSLWAQTSPLLPHQGRIAVGGAYFNGQGQFKFALVSGTGREVFWRNAPDHNGDGEPDAAVSIPVQRGLYVVQLGDSTLPGMAPLDGVPFGSADLYLRIWFDDGVHGFERLEPDLRIPAAPFASMAGNVPDGSISPAKLAPAVLEPVQQQLVALVAELHALSNRHESLAAGFQEGLPPGVPVLSAQANDPTLLARGFAPAGELPAPGWIAGSTIDEPLPRFGHTAVWTGTEMWVWGGTLPDPSLTTASGGIYRPDADAWSALPSVGAPSARTGHSAVWTGQSMIVWGGTGQGQYWNTGGRLAAGTAVWQTLSTNNAPSGREGHICIWTGRQMLVWGGRNFDGLLRDGALYDPSLDQWTALPTHGAPTERFGATGVWTGDSLIVWGGQGPGGRLNDGARLRFDAQGQPVAWEPLAQSNAPSARTGHSAVWTGQLLLIWGGMGPSGPLNDGARYDPGTGLWQPLSTNQAPPARHLHNAVWTGRDMLILGGVAADGTSPPPYAYTLGASAWRPLSTAGNPPGRSQATAVWTGSEVLHFGGRLGTTTLAALYRLNPRTGWYLYVKN